jgi:hypothetical protein
MAGLDLPAYLGTADEDKKSTDKAALPPSEPEKPKK